MLSLFKSNKKVSCLFVQKCGLAGVKDSKWIYSSRHEEKMFRKVGKISIYNHVCDDTHNASLRLVEKMNEAHVIFTNNPFRIRKYLQSLSKMERFARP